jgi:hypothetical protein
MMEDFTPGGCEHNRDQGFDYPCRDCDTTPDDPKLHSISFGFGNAGRKHWHDGPTNRETIKEMFDNAKRYGNEPPEPVNGYASGGPIV